MPYTYVSSCEVSHCRLCMQETVYTSLTFGLQSCWLEGCCYHGTKSGNLKLNFVVQMSTAATGCTHAMTRAVNTHEQGSIEQASLCSNRNQCVPLLLLSTAVVDLAQAPDRCIKRLSCSSTLACYLAALTICRKDNVCKQVQSNSKGNKLVHNRHMPEAMHMLKGYSGRWLGP